MPSDVAIQELLYAILKQKCLKDIDWNLVAADPILTQTITNGHAARMRYARFKKQMEKARENPPPATEPPLPSPRRGRQPKNSSSETKTKRGGGGRVEKNESPKKHKRGSNVLKAEGSSFQRSGGESSFQRSGEESFRSSDSGEREDTVDSTADIPSDSKFSAAELASYKRERISHTQQTHTHPQAQSSSHAQLLAGQGYAQPPTPHENALMTPIASTPRYCVERSASPSPSQGGNALSFGTADYVGSFEMGTSHETGMGSGIGSGMSPLFGEAGYGLGLGFGGVSDVPWHDGSGIWDQTDFVDGQVGTERVSVKQEERWGEEYRR